MTQHVLLAVRLPGVTELYGETIAGEIFSVFKLRDGVIVRIDEFKTRDEALHALATATALDEPISRTEVTHHQRAWRSSERWLSGSCRS